MSRNRDDPHDELVDCIRTHAIRSETTDPNADVDEFAAFDPVIEDVEVVGLGEATHRTREFVRFKHRFFRYLVERHGFLLFGLEAPFSETMALHDYIVYGAGTLDAALDRIDFRIYETEAMATFLEWLRSFNEGRPLSDRIAVYGFDVQSAAGPAQALLQYFEGSSGSSSPARGVPSPDDDVIEALSVVAEGVFESEDVNEKRLRTAEDVVSTLDGRFGPSSGVDSAENDRAPVIAKQHWRTLRQACEFARTGHEADCPAQWGLRDRYMADTVEWILAHADANRIAVWAHDNHVKRGRLTGDGHPSKTMGEHLASRFGNGYYALDAQFGGGTVRAWEPTDGDGEIEVDGQHYSMTEIPVPDPIEGSIPARFTDVGSQVVVVDYRSLREESPLRDWLGEGRPHHFVAGVVDPDDRYNFYREYVSADAFDGLAFVREGTPTRPR